MKFSNTLFLVMSLTLSACATNPVTGKSDFALVSEPEKIKQGRSFHQQIITSYGVYDDPALQQYVNGIGQELAKKENRDPNIYHGVYSTHPRNDDRLKTVVRATKNLPVQTYRDSDQSGYYGKIDGMVWDPSTRQGIPTNNLFTHPDLAFSLQLPETWEANNYPEFLQAANPQTGAIVQIGVTSLKEDESPGSLLKRMSNNKKLEVNRNENGVSARTMAKPRKGNKQPARISAIALDNSLALTLLSTSAEDQFAGTEKALFGIMRSFRRLSQAQIDAIEVPRLQIVSSKFRNFETLAEQSAIEYEALDILRLLNRAYPNGDIAKITKLKTVTFDD